MFLNFKKFHLACQQAQFGNTCTWVSDKPLKTNWQVRSASKTPERWHWAFAPKFLLVSSLHLLPYLSSCSFTTPPIFANVSLIKGTGKFDLRMYKPMFYIILRYAYWKGCAHLKYIQCLYLYTKYKIFNFTYTVLTGFQIRKHRKGNLSSKQTWQQQRGQCQSTSCGFPSPENRNVRSTQPLYYMSNLRITESVAIIQCVSLKLSNKVWHVTCVFYKFIFILSSHLDLLWHFRQ